MSDNNKNYQTTRVVGNFYEGLVGSLFNCKRLDINFSGKLPDLVSSGQLFYIEVKASAFHNGGVINKGQLYGFGDWLQGTLFYSFAYHSTPKGVNLGKTYETEGELVQALDLRSLFLFPYSIVKAHFETSPVKTNLNHDDFVQLRECPASKIFGFDQATWCKLGLKKERYKTHKPHSRVNIITEHDYLTEQILDSLNLEIIQKFS